MPELGVRQHIRNFSRRDGFVKFWLVPTWMGLGLASLLIRIIPFRRLAPMLGDWCGLEKPRIVATISEEARAAQIRETVRLAARLAPWRADCYPQAVIARLMLGICGVPFTLSMGLKRDAASSEIHAHAWVQCGDIDVTGGEGDAEYRAVAIFARYARH